MSTLEHSLPAIEHDAAVGQVFTHIDVTNDYDRYLFEATGQRRAPRAIALDDVLADTGATHLCLPQSVVDRLGLPLVRHVVVSTAAGVRETGLYAGARLTVEGRSGVVQVLAVPDDARPLLGAIAMEELGLEPDLKNRRLRLLPDTGPETYLMT
jgi:predicted aspartyl protease